MGVDWSDWGWRGKFGKHELCAWSDGRWSVHVRLPSHVGGYPSTKLIDFRGQADGGICEAKQAAEDTLKAYCVRWELGRDA